MRPPRHPSSPSSDPPRLLEGKSPLTDHARSLLLSPPPVVPLDANTAMRVRSSVLHASPSPSVGSKQTSGSTSSWAYGKLGLVAASAAALGAGVTTLASTQIGSRGNNFGHATDRSGVVIVSAGARSDGSTPTGVANNGAELRQGNQPHVPGAEAGDSTDSWATRVNGRGAISPGPNDTSAPLAEDGSHPAVGNGFAGAPQLSHGAAPGPDSARGSGATTRNPLAKDTSANTPFLSVSDLEPIAESAFTSGAQQRSASRVVVKPAFRKIAANSASTGGPPRARLSANSLEEETLLLEEARTKLGRDPDAALALALEHQSRFRRGQLLEQRRMIHLEALLRLGRDHEALALAKSIGNSLYQARAHALLEKYGLEH